MPFLTFMRNTVGNVSAEPQEFRSHNVTILNLRMDINIFWYLAMCMNFWYCEWIKEFCFWYGICSMWEVS